VLYSLNREHLAMPAVEALTGMRTELFERIRHSVEGWSPPPVHLSLFGSMARGDGDSESDIDMFVVRPRTVDVDNTAWRSNLEQLQHNIETWTGNHAAPVDVSLEDVAMMRKRRDRLLTEVQRDGVLLTGKPIENVAVPAKRAP
jgi:predicted nucleotidyltransferase